MSDSTSNGHDYLILSSSLNPSSRSRLLAIQLEKIYAKLKVSARHIDLREHPLPFCDGNEAYGDPALPPLKDAVEAARVIIIATPIYNFDANAVIKNFVELTGSTWEHKVVGFLCSAGGKGSYMAPMGLANSLMLDFRCTILPRFVYTTGEDFNKKNQPSSTIIERIEQLARESMAVTVNP